MPDSKFVAKALRESDRFDKFTRGGKEKITLSRIKGKTKKIKVAGTRQIEPLGKNNKSIDGNGGRPRPLNRTFSLGSGAWNKRALRKSSRESEEANRVIREDDDRSSQADSPQENDAVSVDAETPGDDNINVVVRVRPLNKNETERKDPFTVQFPGDGVLWVDNNSSVKPFTFNVLFEPEASQRDVFEHSGVKKLVSMAVDGYACTCFAFGQTGSGKTHSITGPPGKLQSGKRLEQSDYGLIPQSFHNLLHLMKEGEKKGTTYTLKASYFELYNEQILDLLNVQGGKKLNMRWSVNKGFYIENLFTIECYTFDDLMAVLEEGLNNRSTSAHNLNDFSSRSHSMLTLNVESGMQDPDDENLYITKHGKLTFVDLAGSEKVKDTTTSGDQLLETNNINKSLLVLGKCISALGDPKKKNGHIPYRDSKLTKLLADSIGGNGVTLMIACVSPSKSNIGETTNTLRYATRAKKIKNKPVVKMDPRERLILTLKKEIKVLRSENQLLREQLKFPHDGGKVITDKDSKSVSDASKDLPEKEASSSDSLTLEHHTDLYEMLQEYMVENEALRSENSDMLQGKEKMWRDQQFIVRENDRLQRKIEDLQRFILTAPPQPSPFSQHSTRQSSWFDPHSELSSANSGTTLRSYRSVPDVYMGSPVLSQHSGHLVGYQHPLHLNSPNLPPVQHRTPPPNDSKYKSIQSSYHNAFLKNQPHHKPSPPAKYLSQSVNGPTNSYTQKFEVSKSLGARNAFQHSPTNGRVVKQPSGSPMIPMKALPSPPYQQGYHNSGAAFNMNHPNASYSTQHTTNGMVSPAKSSQYNLNEQLKQELKMLEGEILSTQNVLTSIR